MDKIEEKINLIKRRAIEIYSEKGLEDRLKSGKKLTIKLGADPSRPDLHLGHSVVLRALKIFQDLGHEVVFLIGDYTGMIGDPTGKNKTRPPLTFEETRKSGETYLKQVTKILDKEKTRVEYNSTWLSKLTFEDVLKLMGKYTLARLLEREDFSSRYNNKTPIGMHELMYPLMQGYDSVALKADIEIGGTDQTFNLLVGRELQKDYDQAPQEVITFPLLVGLDGVNKMSKSLDNYIGIDESPEVMFEKAMKIPDNVLYEYFRLTTDLNLGEIKKEIENDIINAHKMYAREIITMYHGKQYVKEAEERYKSVAKGAIPENINEFKLEDRSLSLSALITKVGFTSSNSESRRMIQGRGIKVDSEVIEDINYKLPETDFVLQCGKNKFIKIFK